MHEQPPNVPILAVITPARRQGANLGKIRKTGGRIESLRPLVQRIGSGFAERTPEGYFSDFQQA